MSAASSPRSSPARSCRCTAPGLERIVELIDDEETRDRLAADELVAGLLMIHDLYPVPLEERVTRALDTVRPYMESHGGNVELLGVRGRGGAAAPRGELQVVPRVVLDARAGGAAGAPGGGAGPARHGRGGGGRGGRTTRSPGSRCRSSNGTPVWHTLDIDAPDLLAATDVDGMSLVVANVDGTLLAYRNACASCGSELARRRARRRRACVSRAAVAATSCRRQAARWTTSTSSSSPFRSSARRRRSRSRCEAARRGRRKPPPRR